MSDDVEPELFFEEVCCGVMPFCWFRQGLVIDNKKKGKKEKKNLTWESAKYKDNEAIICPVLQPSPPHTHTHFCAHAHKWMWRADSSSNSGNEYVQLDDKSSRLQQQK